jgi:FixJ family two-component response regulator
MLAPFNREEAAAAVTGNVGNSHKPSEQALVSGMLPAITKETHSMQSQQSPVANRRNEISPYAQMMEKNRQFSVTVNKDLANKQSRIAEPLPFGTPSIQMNR